MGGLFLYETLGTTQMHGIICFFKLRYEEIVEREKGGGTFRHYLQKTDSAHAQAGLCYDLDQRLSSSISLLVCETALNLLRPSSIMQCYT